MLLLLAAHTLQELDDSKVILTQGSLSFTASLLGDTEFPLKQVDADFGLLASCLSSLLSTALQLLLTCYVCHAGEHWS